MQQQAVTGLYYQAIIPAERCWMFAAIIRAADHLCFDRTVDKHRDLFEFFVPANNQQKFESLMYTLEQRGLVHSLQQLPNRFANPEQPLHLEA